MLLENVANRLGIYFVVASLTGLLAWSQYPITSACPLGDDREAFLACLDRALLVERLWVLMPVAVTVSVVVFAETYARRRRRPHQDIE